MTREKIEKALKVISAPTGSYDPSTVQTAREILLAAMRLGYTESTHAPCSVLDAGPL